MKNLRFLIVALLVFAMAFASAQKPDHAVTANKVTLVAMIKKANKDCPYDVGDGMTAESIRYVDPDVVFTFLGDFSKSDFAYLEQNSGQIYDAFVKVLKESPDCSKVINLCKSSHSNLILVFKNKAGQKFDLKVDYAKL
ncbi:MAG: hypothetical protein NC102_08225 [Clostridium sp.]|nr:hypothetical protein [Clostridium sp.]